MTDNGRALGLAFPPMEVRRDVLVRAAMRAEELGDDGFFVAEAWGLDAALAYRRMLDDSVKARRLRIDWIDETTEREAWRLLEQYRDVTLSLTDASTAGATRRPPPAGRPRLCRRRAALVGGRAQEPPKVSTPW